MGGENADCDFSEERRSRAGEAPVGGTSEVVDEVGDLPALALSAGVSAKRTLRAGGTCTEGDAGGALALPDFALPLAGEGARTAGEGTVRMAAGVGAVRMAIEHGQNSESELAIWHPTDSLHVFREHARRRVRNNGGGLVAAQRSDAPTGGHGACVFCVAHV